MDFVTYATYWFNQYVIVPTICSLGIIGNVLSIVIIVKSGLRRPSNIILFGLAISDTLTLTHVFDVSEYFYFQDSYCIHECSLLFFSYGPAFAILIFRAVLFFLSALGGRLSTWITVLITVERLIAVFNPLKLSRVMTRRRAWLALGLAVLFWLPWSIFQIFWFQFHFEYDERFESYTAWDSNSDYLNNVNFDVGWFNNVVISQATHTIPLIIVAVGSLAISIRLQTIATKRQKIISSTSVQRSSSRTTKALLMVCVVYSITRFCFVIRNLPWFNSDGPTWSRVAMFYDIIRYLFVDVNSSCNFFIYVVFNPKFRHIFESLFTRHQRMEDSESLYG
ncbi:hypothetical protein BsWGS_06133 [Bradybaena similaris]